MAVLEEVYRYIVDHPDMLLQWTLDHLFISSIAMLAGAVPGLSVGIFMTTKGRERLAETVLYLAEMMMTVPSLALFGLFMLLMGRLGFTAIGMLPAIVTLIVYGQLPILRNTYTAIRDVDPDIIEAGRGMGMRNSQLLIRVKLPMAMPVIMAGLRNAMVLMIGITAIAALIGAGGLGVPIFRGLRNARMDLIIIGGAGVSILALLVDGMMLWLEKRLVSAGLKG